MIKNYSSKKNEIILREPSQESVDRILNYSKSLTILSLEDTKISLHLN